MRRSTAKPQVNPLSMLGQLLRVPAPSRLEIARDKERAKERVRKASPEEVAKQRERSRAYRERQRRKR